MGLYWVCCCCCCCIVAAENLHLEQMDVKTDGELDEDIYIKQPEGYEVPGKEHMVCKFKRSLYGLKEAPRQWYKKFDSFMCKSGSSMEEINNLKARLSKEFEMKDLGAAQQILGMRISQDRCTGTLNLSHEQYIKKVLGLELMMLNPGILLWQIISKWRSEQSPKTTEEREYMSKILNVYITKYDSEGKYWVIVHNTTIFSLVIAQIIAMGVFALKESTICLGFTIPLAICTLLFNEYCRRRFLPVFGQIAAEVLIDLDQQDEQSGKMEEIHEQLQSAYCQLEWLAYGSSRIKLPYLSDDEDCLRSQELKPESEFSQEITADQSIQVKRTYPTDLNLERKEPKS